jgi:hypothetical protein
MVEDYKNVECRESSLVVKEVDNVGNRYFSGTPRVVDHAKSLSVL